MFSDKTKLQNITSGIGRWSENRPMERRTMLVLGRHGIETLGQLRRTSFHDIAMLTGVGRVALRNVIEVLDSCGVYGV